MATLNDQAVLANDVLFQGRVREALAAACIAIGTEATSTAFHFIRVRGAVTILNNLEMQSGNMSVWVLRFAATVATDANVIADATAGPTVLTTANVDAQQALITDAHISAAVSGQFNSFFYPA